jgi:hypothetical protein
MGKSFKANVEDSLQAFYENKKRIKKVSQERRSSRLTDEPPTVMLPKAKPWRVKQ